MYELAVPHTCKYLLFIFSNSLSIITFSFNLSPEHGTFALAKFDLSDTTLMTTQVPDSKCNPGGNNRKPLVNTFDIYLALVNIDDIYLALVNIKAIGKY